MSRKKRKPILSELRQIALPASIGFLFNTLFNVVDSFYAGRIGTDAIAGMALAFPVFLLLIALAAGLGNAINALSSIALGKEDPTAFHRLLKNSVLISVVFAIMIPLVAPSLARLVFDFQGAEDAASRYAMRYIQTVMLGFGFFMFNFSLNGFLYAQGNAKPFRNFLIVASLLNIILNPIFIYGFLWLPPLDTQGIALATVLVQMGGSVYLAYKVWHSPEFKRQELKETAFSLSTIRELMGQALPSALNTATIALGIFVINYYVQRYGGTTTLAGYGIAVRIEQLALVPTIGLNVAVISLVGRSFGREDRTRLYDVWKKATLSGLIIMAVGVLLIVPFAPFLVALFDRTEDVVAAGSRYLRIEAFAFFSYIFLNINVSVLQGIKRPGFSFFIGVFRQFVPIWLFYFLGTTLSLGVDGVWWGIVIINWMAVIILMAYTIPLVRKVTQSFNEASS